MKEKIILKNIFQLVIPCGGNEAENITNDRGQHTQIQYYVDVQKLGISLDFLLSLQASRLRMSGNECLSHVITCILWIIHKIESNDIFFSHPFQVFIIWMIGLFTLQFYMMFIDANLIPNWNLQLNWRHI